MARGWIYLFSAERGQFKIGQSIDPQSRIKSFSTLPFNVKLIHQIAATDVNLAESAMHSLFSNKRTTGEWFKLSDQDVKWLKNLLIIDRFDTVAFGQCPNNCDGACSHGCIGCSHISEDAVLCEICVRFIEWRNQEGEAHSKKLAATIPLNGQETCEDT